MSAANLGFKDMYFRRNKQHTMSPSVTHLAFFALFLVCGFLVFGLPLIFPYEIQIVYRIIVLAVFLAITLLLRGKTLAKRYFFVSFAFFTAQLVVTLDYLLYSNWSVLGFGGSRMDQYVLAKVISTVLIVVPIIALTKLVGQKLSSIFLTRGRLKLGLLVGLALFFFFFATSIPVATFLYGGKDLSYGNLVVWGPWILVFVLANGLREELLFRGLFLAKYQAFLGLGVSNFLQALVFVMPHFGESYSPITAVFLAVTFLLGLAFGALIQKTNSLLGSILFHAGADLPVVLGVFSNF